MIEVFFKNGNRAKFQRDKALFVLNDGSAFSFNKEQETETANWPDAIDRGAVINMDAVAWIRLHRERTEEE